MQWYAHQVANHPSLVILFVLTAAGICIIISLTTSQLPSFRDPLLGFEPRGTELGQRATAWKNLLNSTSWLGPMSMFPGHHKNKLVAQHRHNFTPQVAALRVGGDVEIKVDSRVQGRIENESNLEAEPGGRSGTWMVLNQEGRQRKEEKARRAPRPWNFCNDPSRAYAHVIVESASHQNLLSLESLLAICRISEFQLKQSSQYTLLCETNINNKKCCKSWSLPNYIAMLQGRKTCRNLTQTDINAVLDRLQACAGYYHTLKLSHDCAAEPGLCRGIPLRCTEHNAVYNILHYLVDTDFMSMPENSTKLSYSSIFLPIAQSIATMDYFHDLENTVLGIGDIKVTGIQFGLKHALFDQKVVHDSYYVGLAGLIIFVFLWMYTTSFFVTFMTNLSVLFSLAIAYFMYVTVFNIAFFPFMNILAVVIATGIGADDAFIYCKIWTCAKAEKNSGTLVKLVRDTLHHACLSMFITSITTAAAFFGSFTSSITAVRCFSIFAGMAVLANFLFTVTCLPASVIIAERWCSCTCCLCIPPFGIYLPPLQRFRGCSWLCNSLWKMHYGFIDGARVFFEKILPCMIIKPRSFWVFLFTALAIGASVAVFYYPKLQLPNTKDFQIFSSDHPFEKYDLLLKKKFWFEKAREHDYDHALPIRIVWGILPVDNGNYLNPYDKGSLEYDEDFDVAAPESQVWLLNFCKQLRAQSFYQPTVGPLLPNCFIQTLNSFMDRKCVDGFTDANRYPCCESSKFPYSREVFNLCLRLAVDSLRNTQGYYIFGVAGPRFSVDDDQIKAVVIEYDSSYSYSNSYGEMYEFKTKVDGWVKNMLAAAPKGMRNGWFISDLEFFDLQDSLAQGTLIAIGVAIGVSFVALLVTTLNLLISLYAIFTISCIIVVTVASLILLGWKLNILESITVSVAIGLAVDLTLHYGVAYRLSSQEDRESSVIYSISRIGSPVAMGAFTTFVAGALMFPSSVLTYLQIGTFLVLVVTVSWIYATFLFQSLLSLIGPQNGQLQLRYPNVQCCCCCCETATAPVDKTAYALSESTLSTSSASYPTQLPANETHELEPLTTVKGLRNEMLKYAKKKPRTIRQRSGSFSAALSRKHDPNFTACTVNGSRKVSLPTVNVTFHEDPGPQYEGLEGNSSSTIVGVEEETDSCVAEQPQPDGINRDTIKIQLNSSGKFKV